MGVNGKVGQAAVQIASWHGARVIGVVRKSEPYEGHANGKVEVIDASVTDVAARVRELTDGKGADIVFNTVGDPYFQAAHKSLALRGRQILIAAIDRIVPVQHPRILSRPAHLCRHRYAGAVIDRDRRGAPGARSRFRQRASEAVPDPAECDLSAGTGQGRLSCGRRFLARPRDPAAGGIGTIRSHHFRASAAGTKPFAFRLRAKVLFSLRCAARQLHSLCSRAVDWPMRGNVIAGRESLQPI